MFTTATLLVIAAVCSFLLLGIGVLLNGKEKFDNRTRRILSARQREEANRLAHTHYYGGK